MLAVCCVFLTSCAKNKTSVIGVIGDEYGVVGTHRKSCEVPDGFIYMSPKIMDSIVESKIEQL